MWEKVYLKGTDFLESTHGKVGCVICHGGNSQAEEKELAHQGVVADPSEESCTPCHRDVAELHENSLHATLSGFKTKLEARGANLSEGSALTTALDNHCQQCHTSCGQCHVSRPDEMGGGLVSGHVFRKTPSMQYNCTACHGARVGDEYLGNNEGVPADVHWQKAGMTCAKCHGQELHGTGAVVSHRYANAASPKCEDCHQDVWTETADNPQHRQHLGELDCYVCHAVAYKNCYDCHVGIDDKGLPYFRSEPSEIGFKIGLNPIRSSQRPYKYVVLRHIPVCADTFDYYGSDLLPDFETVSTWKYATPHNIQLHTPQNESCDSCHGNKSLFLTGDDLDPAEREANRGVIVIQAPPSK